MTIQVVKFDHKNLPSNAVYNNKEKISYRDNIWFVDLINFNRIIINYNNVNGLKFSDYLITMQSMLIKFMKTHGGTYMLEKKHITEELIKKTVKINLHEDDLIKYKNKIIDLNYTNLANNEKIDRMRDEIFAYVKKVFPLIQSVPRSLFDNDSDSNKSYDSDDNNEDEDEDNDDVEDVDDIDYQNKIEREKLKSVYSPEIINNIRHTNNMLRNIDIIIKEPIVDHYKEINSMIGKTKIVAT